MKRAKTPAVMAGVGVATLCLALLAGGWAGAKPDQHLYYLQPDQVDLTTLLPPPPDPNSPTELSDEKQVASIVAKRTPAEVTTAEEDAKRTVFFFAPAVGAGFVAERLPLTGAFFHRVSSDVENVVRVAKDHWERPRPAGATQKHGSYPSGHAAFAASTAIILAQMIPERSDAIFAQARLFAENRIILGVHYPSDVAAGWTAGTVAVVVMARDARYQVDYAAARAEVRKALGLP